MVFITYYSRPVGQALKTDKVAFQIGIDPNHGLSPMKARHAEDLKRIKKKYGLKSADPNAPENKVPGEPWNANIDEEAIQRYREDRNKALSKYRYNACILETLTSPIPANQDFGYITSLRSVWSRGKPSMELQKNGRRVDLSHPSSYVRMTIGTPWPSVSGPGAGTHLKQKSNQMRYPCFHVTVSPGDVFAIVNITPTFGQANGGFGWLGNIGHYCEPEFVPFKIGIHEVTDIVDYVAHVREGMPIGEDVASDRHFIARGGTAMYDRTVLGSKNVRCQVVRAATGTRSNSVNATNVFEQYFQIDYSFEASEIEECWTWWSCANISDYISTTSTAAARTNDARARREAIESAPQWKKLLNRLPDEHVETTLPVSSEISLSYPSLNSTGILVFNIDPEFHPPKLGDIVKLFSGEVNDMASVHPILFRGTITQLQRTESAYTLTCEDTLGMLADKSIFAISKLTAREALTSICDAAGVIWYVQPGFYFNPSQQYTELYTSTTYLDAITDVINKVLVMEGKHFILQDVAGVIRITGTDQMRTEYVLTMDNIGSYTFNSDLKTATYNRAVITYTPENTSKAGSNKNILGSSVFQSISEIQVFKPPVDVNGMLTYGRFLTFMDNRAGLAEAKSMGGLIMKYRNIPYQTIDLRECTGIEGLIPGNSVNIDIKLDGRGIYGMTILIKAISHRWDENGHNMDISALCNVYNVNKNEDYVPSGGFEII